MMLEFMNMWSMNVEFVKIEYNFDGFYFGMVGGGMMVL